MRLMSMDWRTLDNLTFDLSPDDQLIAAQDRILHEVQKLSDGH
jgi:hypothetical protein